MNMCEPLERHQNAVQELQRFRHPYCADKPSKGGTMPPHISRGDMLPRSPYSWVDQVVQTTKKVKSPFHLYY